MPCPPGDTARRNRSGHFPQAGLKRSLQAVRAPLHGPSATTARDLGSEALVALGSGRDQHDLDAADLLDPPTCALCYAVPRRECHYCPRPRVWSTCGTSRRSGGVEAGDPRADTGSSPRSRGQGRADALGQAAVKKGWSQAWMSRRERPPARARCITPWALFAL